MQQFIEAIRMAWEALKSNKLRTLLTLVGMVIGVFAIITSVTAVRVIEVYFEEKVNFLGSGTFTVSRYPEIQMQRRKRDRKSITYDQVEQLSRSVSMPMTISPMEDFSFGAVRYGAEETEPNIVLLGTNEHALENFSLELAQGRGITDSDNQYGRSVIVLGSVVAADLFPNTSPLQKVVRVDGRKYQVIGVLAEKGNFLGMSQDNRVLAPMNTLFSYYGQPQRNIASISIRVSNTARIPAAMDEVINRMRIVRKVAPGEENDFEVESNDTFKDFFSAITGTLTAVGAGIGLIALLAAGIGIMNIMLVSVTERTREIGIRKSIGAKRKAILGQFLMEAIFLCQLGGLFGVGLGVLVGNLVALYFGISTAIPWDWAMGGLLAVTGIALVFGVYPAFKAASLSPIAALRHE